MSNTRRGSRPSEAGSPPARHHVHVSFITAEAGGVQAASFGQRMRTTMQINDKFKLKVNKKIKDYQNLGTPPEIGQYALMIYQDLSVPCSVDLVEAPTLELHDVLSSCRWSE